MLEKYYRYRIQYEEYIIFIKSGNFYEVFDKDSLILNKIFGYKVKRIQDNIKVGFPVNKLQNILNLLNNINYIIVDKENIKEKKYEDNRYSEYKFNMNNILINSIRIDRINKYLLDRLLDGNINSLLNNIEGIL
jgi:DNA mismatch repair ATPase MutS